ncbi:MAG: LD-carboxypeptidase [Chthonomonadales bacterium]
MTQDSDYTPFRPNRLQPGMTIAIIAPSSGRRDDRFEPGVAQLESRGYNVKVMDHVLDQHGYLAGLDRQRASDFTRAFADPEVNAVICARGGYGAMRMVDLVDWDVVKQNPKPFIGYSDITTLHLAIEKNCGRTTIYGPMVGALGGTLSSDALDCFWKMLESNEPFGLYPKQANPPVTLVPGKAKGRLAGGCITLLGGSIGTTEHTDFAGRIVVLEDISESIYRLDRTLTHLLRSTNLSESAGLVIGTNTDWAKEETDEIAITLDDLWQNIIAPLGIPTIVDFQFGHEPDPFTIPLGCMAELDATRGTLAVLESPFV